MTNTCFVCFIVSDVLTLIATNLIVILYTTLALRLARFDEFPPNKSLYKVSFLHPSLTPICVLRLKADTESLRMEGINTAYVYVDDLVV